MATTGMIRKKTFKKRVYKKKTYKPKVSTTLKNYVKKVVHAQIENKHINIEQARTFGSNIADTIFPMTPYTGLVSLPIGTTQGTRIGNVVKTRRVTLNYVLRPTSYAAGLNDLPQPAQIVMFLGNYKQAPGILPTSLELSVLFDNGSGSLNPQGDLSDLIADINKEAWNIKKRWSHKVGMALHAGAGNQPNFSQFANNDFKYNVVKKMDITKMCPKTIKFNDSSGSNQGPNLFLFYEALQVNGGIFPAAQRPFAIDYWVKYEYEDA